MLNHHVQMLNNQILNSYVGHKFNADVEAEINDVFKPFVLTLCSRDYFYLEIHFTNQIRCVVENGIIVMLRFN